MLDKGENFIKLKKINEKTPRRIGERVQCGARSVFRMDSPTAFAVKEPKDMDGLAQLHRHNKIISEFLYKGKRNRKKGLLFI